MTEPIHIVVYLSAINVKFPQKIGVILKGTDCTAIVDSLGQNFRPKMTQVGVLQAPPQGKNLVVQTVIANLLSIGTVCVGL